MLILELLMQILMLEACLLEMGPSLTGRKLTIWKVSFCPTMVIFLCNYRTLQRHLYKIYKELFHFLYKSQTYITNARTYFCWEYNRFQKGLPNTNALKGQTKLHQHTKLANTFPSTNLGCCYIASQLPVVLLNKKP